MDPRRIPVLAALAMCCAALAAAPDGEWLFPDSAFRVPVDLETGIYRRADALVQCAPSFADLQDGTEPDPGSVRVAAVADDGVQGEVPCKITPHQLVWRAAGEHGPLETLRYLIYFDRVTDEPRPRPATAGLDMPANMVRNPGFESVSVEDPTVPEDWSTFVREGSTGTISVVERPTYAGNRALEITCTSGKWFGCRQDRIPMKPNALYRAGAWLRPDPENAAADLQGFVTVWLHREDGSYVGMRNAKIQRGTPLFPGQWSRLATRGLAYKGVDVLTTPDTGYGEVQIHLHPVDPDPTREAIGTLYVDDVELVEVTAENRKPPMAVRFGAVQGVGGK